MILVLPNIKRLLQRKYLFIFTVFLSIYGIVKYLKLYSLVIPITSTTNYIPSLKKNVLLPQSEGHFSLLTYNIAGLPGIISSAKTKRDQSIYTIGERLATFDIVNVQEDFNYNEELYNGDRNHLYRTRTMGVVLTGDGLNTLSKFPISSLERIEWNDRTGADLLTPKGFTCLRIEISQNIYLDLYNVHANAQDEPYACEARRKNMIQLSAYIAENSKNNAIIVMGDLNSHYSYALDNVAILLNENMLTDSWLKLYCNNVLPNASQNIPNQDIIHLNNQQETIDKILYRSSNDLILTPNQISFVGDIFSDSVGNPLSDHLPLSATFHWQLITHAPHSWVKR